MASLFRSFKIFSSKISIGNRSFSNDVAKVIVEELNHITLIGINRPEKRNCVDPPTAIELVTAFKAFEENSNSPVAILYGKGGNFCSGFDLSYLATQGQDEKNILDSYFFNPHNKEVGPMGPTRKQFFSKPVIAAVSGYAVAGGLELALMCDLRVVEDTAILGVFCRRFGVPLLDGGTVRLPHLIGLSRAMDLILTGRPINGKEAFEMGLSNRLTSCGTAVGKAMQLARSIAIHPQECMNRDRMSAYNSMYCSNSFDSAMEYEMKHGIEIIDKESVAGSIRFTNGVGRHGTFPGKDEIQKREQ